MFVDDVCDSSYSTSGAAMRMAGYYWLAAVTLPFAERGLQPELPLVTLPQNLKTTTAMESWDSRALQQGPAMERQTVPARIAASQHPASPIGGENPRPRPEHLAMERQTARAPAMPYVQEYLTSEFEITQGVKGPIRSLIFCLPVMARAFLISGHYWQ
ncbi:hypothetical protein BDW71DRAFT_204203 [Aspergillus fruticulosus]